MRRRLRQVDTLNRASLGPLPMGQETPQAWEAFLPLYSGTGPSDGLGFCSHHCGVGALESGPRFLPVVAWGGGWLMNTTLSGRHRSPWKTSVVAQSCATLCDHMDCNPPGSYVHGIFQARRPLYIPTEGKSLLCKKWVATSFSRGSSRPRARTCVSYIGRWNLYR